MFYFRNQQEYDEYQYRRRLRKTSNGLGALMLIFFGAEFLLSIVLVVVLQILGLSDIYKSGSAIDMLSSGVLSAIIFFFVGLIYCLITKRSFARLFPFERVGAGMTFMLCAAGLALCLMSNIAADAVTQVFGLFGIQNTGGQPLEDGALPSVLLYYLTVALMPAFVEEFAFRGVVMGSLRPYSEGLAVLISSALFALMHGNFVQIPFTFCCGLVFGFVAIKTNSLLPSMILHFLNNGLSVTADVLDSYHLVPANITNFAYGVIFVVSGILALVLIRLIIKKKPDMFKVKDSDKVIPYRQKVKTVVTSPTMIIFAAAMLLYAVWILVSD